MNQLTLAFQAALDRVRSAKSEAQAHEIALERIAAPEPTGYRAERLDPRLEHLSPTTRAKLLDFAGDIDEAAYAASRLVHLYAQPPAWAIELHGAQRSGWREFNTRRIA